MTSPIAQLATRLERAFAASTSHVAASMKALKPESKASTLDVGGGVAVFAGEGSPYTQALAMGLSGAVTAGQLDIVETFLNPSGKASVQIELTPFADPSLAALLAARGYRVNEWQLVWTRGVGPVEGQQPMVRAIQSHEAEKYVRATLAGFLESEDAVPSEHVELMLPAALAADHQAYVAEVEGEVIVGASLCWNDSVAFINGCGVRPSFRGRGAHGELIRARLAQAHVLGCELACSSTAPASASRRNMERNGFTVVYPKVVMLRPPLGS